MKNTTVITALTLCLLSSIASAQNSPNVLGNGSGMSNFNQRYFQRNPIPQAPLMQPGAGGALGSGYQGSRPPPQMAMPVEPASPSYPGVTIHQPDIE